MASTIKVNNIQNTCGANIINESANTITLGASGDTITLACGASQTGFGRTGTVDWDTTPKTATFSAVSGNGYFVNTTAGVITVNLPAGVAGAIVSLADYAATWQTNNLTVSPNGTDKIGSVNENATLSTEGQSVTFVYVDSTQGWINTMDSTSNVRGIPPYIAATGGTITCCGDYKIHTFTGPGTFTVTNAGTPIGSNTVDYLVVAGGGGGGSLGPNGAGGGGAGGFRESSGAASGCYSASPLGACVSALPVTATAFPITVGGGGAGAATIGASGAAGSNSIFSTITSTGGGLGQYTGVGGSGGSGGGPGGGPSPGAGGTGNSPPTNPPQGNPGSAKLGSPDNYGGAGGGAGGAGADRLGGCGIVSDGGVAVTSSINGTATTYAGGGGGGGSPFAPGGTGGTGGGPGGNAGVGGNPGSSNTGGGGGGGGSGGPVGGSGGSGIVVIRYKFQN
jgi:hypothetical protein